jgi:hypothetical protein
VEHVFPDVPVRQWVLTVPHRLRYLLAWNHGLTRAVAGVFMRAVLGWQRRRARVAQGIADGRGGAVAMVQRFGAALNTNVHIHALVHDGVFAEEAQGTLVFHPAGPPGEGDLEALVGWRGAFTGRSRDGTWSSRTPTPMSPIRGWTRSRCWRG